MIISKNEFPVAETTGGQAMHGETYRRMSSCFIWSSFPGRQRSVTFADSPIRQGRTKRKKETLVVETIGGMPVVIRRGVHMQDENMSIYKHTPKMCVPTVETTAG